MATAVRIYKLPGLPTRPLRKVQRLGFRDEFERIDSDTTLGSTIDGKAWVPLRGVWGIAGGNAKLVSNSASGTPAVVVDALTADGIFTAEWAVRDGGDVAGGLVIRVLDVNNHLFLNSSGSGQLRLWKRVNGTATEIKTATTGGVIQSGSIVRVVLNGSSIKVYLNNVLVIDATDSTFIGATRHGLAINTGYVSRIARATFAPIVPS